MQIIGTLGPSCMDLKVLEKMINNGLNAIRISFSHIDKYKPHEIEKIIKFLKGKVLIIADINGGKIRISNLYKEEKKVFQDEYVYFCSEDEYKDIKPRFKDKNLIPLVIDKKILMSSDIKFLTMKENTMKFLVKERFTNVYKTLVKQGGVIRAEKGCNIPQLRRKHITLSENDKKNIKLALELDVDVIALSYVERGKQIKEAIDYIKALNSKVSVWSKVESTNGYLNIREIVTYSDGIIVGRGDLVPEMGIIKVPLVETNIVKIGNKFGKPVIIATNVIPSLKTKMDPTINEVEAVYMHMRNGSAGFMLSSETSIGKEPVRAILCISKLIREYSVRK